MPINAREFGKLGDDEEGYTDEALTANVASLVAHNLGVVPKFVFWQEIVTGAPTGGTVAYDPTNSTTAVMKVTANQTATYRLIAMR